MPKSPEHKVVPAVLVGRQALSERFTNDQRQVHERQCPPIAIWRCNLTGLSQIHNLYFVAYGRDIYVYVPRFPSQTTPRQPALIVRSSPTSPGLPGYIDVRHPHYINYLVVQFLGNEESVAVVRDDGDVDLFLVRHIAQAIARRAEPDSALGALTNEIRPFFQRNVGASAWGLAIHSQARILAVSSNRHEISIFRFGLIRAEDQPIHDRNNAKRYDSGDMNLATADRETDVTIQTQVGSANMPWIAFCNTGDDPIARWLLVTDVSGFCRVLHLPDLKTARTFRFAHPNSVGYPEGLDTVNGGWVISFLNRRSFRAVKALGEALGLDDEYITTTVTAGASSVWDITKSAHLLNGTLDTNGSWNSKKRRRARHSAQREDLSFTPVNVPAEQGWVSGSSDGDDEDGGVSLHPGHQAESDPVLGLDDDSIRQSPSFSTHSPGPGNASFSEEVSAGREAEDERSQSSSSASESGANLDIAYADDDNDYDEPEDEHGLLHEFYESQAIQQGGPEFWTWQDLPVNQVPCPIFHSSFCKLYLVQPFNNCVDVNNLYRPPMTGLANPIRTGMLPEYEYLRRIDRLNMFAEISALGVIVVATQEGRALVLSLTKLCPSTPRSHTFTHDATLPSLPGDGTIYTMRLEHILPSREMEQAGERPIAPLHGIAVSPLQGSADSRWRLMMMYQDHSILSYEIGRAETSEGSLLDIEQLVM